MLAMLKTPAEENQSPIIHYTKFKVHRIQFFLPLSKLNGISYINQQFVGVFDIKFIEKTCVTLFCCYFVTIHLHLFPKSVININYKTFPFFSCSPNYCLCKFQSDSLRHILQINSNLCFHTVLHCLIQCCTLSPHIVKQQFLR